MMSVPRSPINSAGAAPGRKEYVQRSFPGVRLEQRSLCMHMHGVVWIMPKIGSSSSVIKRKGQHTILCDDDFRVGHPPAATAVPD